MYWQSWFVLLSADDLVLTVIVSNVHWDGSRLQVWGRATLPEKWWIAPFNRWCMWRGSSFFSRVLLMTENGSWGHEGVKTEGEAPDLPASHPHFWFWRCWIWAPGNRLRSQQRFSTRWGCLSLCVDRFWTTGRRPVRSDCISHWSGRLSGSSTRGGIISYEEEKLLSISGGRVEPFSLQKRLTSLPLPVDEFVVLFFFWCLTLK